MDSKNKVSLLTDEQRARLKELSAKLNSSWALGLDAFSTEEQDEFYKLNRLYNEEYRQNNEDPLWDFYDAHIAGKNVEEIKSEDLDFFSDYHKDVYGFRPRGFFNADGVAMHHRRK